MNADEPVEHDPSTDAAEAVGRAQRAFEHAVEREQAAICMHEDAAARHDDIAEQHEHAAAALQGEPRRQLTELAALERERAARARARAEEVRTRLRSDNVTPEA